MAVTRSSKLRCRSAAKTKKGKRAPQPRQVTYRGLFHGSIANLCRRTKYGPKPIPKDDCTAEMLRLAGVVGKPLPKADWYPRYTSRHVHAAVADGFLEEHAGGALSVTPMARLRYRAARRVARKSRSDASPALYAIEMCRNLDREVGPTALKSKAELIAENNVLSARFNAEYATPRKTPLQAWDSMSTITDADGGDDAMSQYGGDDYDSGDTVDVGGFDDECPAAAGPSVLKSPIKILQQIPYPSPQSLPRNTRSWADRPTAPMPLTPTPHSKRSLSQHLDTPVSPQDQFVVNGRVEFIAEKTDDGSQDGDDVLTLEVPAQTSLTVTFSAASLKRRIHELEHAAATHDADLAHLQTARDGLAQLAADLQHSAHADAQTIATLRASVARRDAEIAALQTRLVAQQRALDACAAALRGTEAELVGCREEKAALEADIGRLQAEIEGAQGARAAWLREREEEFAVRLQLVREQMEEASAKYVLANEKLAKIRALTD